MSNRYDELRADAYLNNLKVSKRNRNGKIYITISATDWISFEYFGNFIKGYFPKARQTSGSPMNGVFRVN